MWSFDNSVSFPCFTNDAMFIQMTEFDNEVNDYTQIQIDCKSIQLGDDGFELII